MGEVKKIFCLIIRIATSAINILRVLIQLLGGFTEKEQKKE